MNFFPKIVLLFNLLVPLVKSNKFDVYIVLLTYIEVVSTQVRTWDLPSHDELVVSGLVSFQNFTYRYSLLKSVIFKMQPRKLLITLCHMPQGQESILQQQKALGSCSLPKFYACCQPIPHSNQMESERLLGTLKKEYSQYNQKKGCQVFKIVFQEKIKFVKSSCLKILDANYIIQNTRGKVNNL